MKPILFNTEMVRAINEERKTVTRRVVKPQPKGRLIPEHPNSCWPGYFGEEGTPRVVRPPYFVGDILYVRETFFEYNGRFYYKEDNKHKALDAMVGHSFFKWRPSIHMPKKAARIFLRVTNVRVEQLLELKVKDAIREGADVRDPYRDFRAIWNGTMKAKDRKHYGWAANPWVWVIEFERISREEAMKGEVE